MEAFDAKEKTKLEYKKTRFKIWLIRCSHFASSLMKEVLFYTVESSRVVDAYLSLDIKWAQYKNIVRVANGQCRVLLSEQAAEKTIDAPFDWDVIECAENKRGRIMIFQNNLLEVATKVRKRNFIDIIDVKATGIEEKFEITKYVNLPPIYSDDKMTLDQLHFLCYCMAMDHNQIPRTSIFKLLGMSQAGLATLREWLFDYYVYDVPDDSFKSKIFEFQNQNAMDYIIMKTTFKLINFYQRRNTLFHLPLCVALRQMNALRRRYLHINDWDPSPQKLGVHYQCHGCQKFANSFVSPINYTDNSIYNEFYCSRHRIYNPTVKSKNNTLFYDQKNQRVIEYYTQSTPSQTAPPPVEHNSILNVAAYDIDNGLAYCRRNKKKRIANYASTTSTSDNNIIMRVGNINISCNKVASSTTTPTIMSANDSVEEDDDEESIDEDITHLLLNIDQLTKSGQKHLKQYTSSLINGIGKKKENKKKRILAIVNDPLHKFYHCQLPMQAIDMVGVVKNGKVLCVECGFMTEYKNYNMSTYGPVCMQHHSNELMKNHPVFVNDQTVDTQEIHRRLMIPERRSCSCQICHKTNASLILVIRGEKFKLLPVKCCTVCYNNLTNQRRVKTSSSFVLVLDEINQYIIYKKYPTPLIIL
jgi:hypothetical protein